MAIAWPSGAPQFAESWQEQDQPVTVRTEMDVGPPKVRRRYTRTMRLMNVGFVGTHEQWNALKEFYEIDCQGGVEFHTFRHPYENTLQDFRFREAPSSTNMSALGVTINCVWEQL